MIDAIINSLTGLVLIKIGYLILSGLLFVFLLVVLKQAYAMRAVINDEPASSLVNSVALLNIIVGFSLFVAALVVL